MSEQDDAERLALWRKQEAEFEARFSDRKAADYHIQCRDCGVFLKKSRWIKKDSFDAIEHQRRPLCGPCWNEYDHYY